MNITDLTFLFLFLPIVLVMYYLCREEIREYILLLASFVFYACGSVACLLILIVSLVVNLSFGYLIEKNRSKKKIGMWLLILGVIYNLCILAYYKYAGFIIARIGCLPGLQEMFQNVSLPLGLSFFTFKAISYLVDIYSEKITIQRNFARAALYLSFFAQIQSGPLSRYQSMQPDHVHLQEEIKISKWFDSFSEGAYRFIIGFNKKVLIADVLANISTETFVALPDHRSAAYAWLGAVCFSLQLFFDFSGYSDMAIGLSKMFGYSCPENFKYPYASGSISEFWRRWHITLGSWFRDYVYIPLGGSRVEGNVRLCLNLFIVWILTGIWHGASWNFLFWGMAYFALIAFEKITGWPGKFRTKAGRIGYRVAMLFFVNFQWVIFKANGLKAGLKYIGNMLGASSNALADRRTLFLIKDNFVFILAAIILCIPVVPWIEKKMGQHRVSRVVWEITSVFVHAGLFLWAVSFIVSGRNNPFAYADF